MVLKRCFTCQGYGKIMSGGMIYKNCHECNGVGKVNNDISFGRQDKRYKNSLKKIKDLDPSITDVQAEKIFDEELHKIKAEIRVQKERYND